MPSIAEDTVFFEGVEYTEKNIFDPDDLSGLQYILFESPQTSGTIVDAVAGKRIFVTQLGYKTAGSNTTITVSDTSGVIFKDHFGTQGRNLMFDGLFVCKGVSGSVLSVNIGADVGLRLTGRYIEV